MSGYTKGPWKLFSVYAQHEIRTPTDSLVAVADSREDARLISAAPELLEALVELLNLCAIGDVDEDTEALGWGGAIRDARAAISKATGAQP